MNKGLDFLYQDYRETGDIADMIETLVVYTKHLEERIEKLEKQIKKEK